MLQAILQQPGKISIEEVAIPEPKKGEVLIQVRAALTCGTDLKAYLRGHPLIPMPGPFGHEFAGVVVKTGPEVSSFKEGDPVMGVHSAPCHRCFYCRRGFFNLCENIMKTKVLGAYGQYLLIPSHVVKENLYKKPEFLPFEIAALLEPLSCVVHPYEKINIDKINEVLVIGAGPIGLLHLIYLLREFKVNICVMDINSERLSVAQKTGASVCTKETIKEKLREGGFDLVVECTGRPDVWMEAINYVRKGGMVILFGGCPSKTTVTYSTARLHYDELTLMGSFHYNPSDVAKARDFLVDHYDAFHLLISGKYSLKELSNVFDLLKKGIGLKYVIYPNEGSSSV